MAGLLTVITIQPIYTIFIFVDKLDEKIHKAATTCLYTVDKVLSQSEHKVKSLRP